MPRLFVNNLTVIDFSFACAQRGIVGASWIVDIQLEGDLNEQGMVFDFGHVKKTIKQFIDDSYDHKLWVSKTLPAFEHSLDKDYLQLSWQNQQQEGFKHASPASAVCLIDQDEISPAVFEPIIAAAIKAILPSNVTGVELSLREELIEGADYCYTHGLQKHDGNCQRIAHGHRSRIAIWENEQRSPELEAHWAQLWHDIYLVSSHHIVSKNSETTHIRYLAEQGMFELSLPTRHVYEFDIVSTVENIASYLAVKTKQLRPEQAITVQAFEGVEKGAFASA